MTRKATKTEELKSTIESAFERRAELTSIEIEGSTRTAVELAIEGLESGKLRVAEPDGKGGWKVNEWLKKAVLLYFRVNEMELVEAYPAPFWDKVEARFGAFDENDFRKLGVRVVPGAIARRGTYFGKDVVLMPSFVNIGAYVGEGTMVDTWATVGSCAQVGKHCHLSGGAGIGGRWRQAQLGRPPCSATCCCRSRGPRPMPRRLRPACGWRVRWARTCQCWKR